MKRLLFILFLLWICCVARGAVVGFGDFNTNQFILTSPIGPEPRISLLPGGTVTNYVIVNITNNILVSSNAYFTNISTTNITVQTINNTTNNTFFTFTTNLISQYSIITNLTVNYFTVNSNANIVGYIRDFNGLGTNTTLSQPVLVAPVYIVSSNGLPIAFNFLDGDNSTILGGWNTNLGGFFGNGGGLTNLHVSGVVTNEVPATNVFSGGVLPTNTLSATAGANGWILGQSNAAPVWTQNGPSITNLTYQYTTNAIASATIQWGQAIFTNIAANFTASIAAPANAFYETAILWVTNSSGTDFKVTMPNGVWGPPGSGTPPAFYCTNKMLTTILLQHYGQLMTNAIKQDYAP